MSNIIDPKYTFDSFIVDDENNYTKVISLAVAEAPGEIYNPLFIYGEIGLGKTHLLQAIGNHILKNNPKSKVLYISCEDFINEVVELFRGKQTSQEEIMKFRKKYMNVDVLLIDDIHLILNRERTQEELFNILNELIMKNKQIVLTSDKEPKEMEGIEKRIIARFSFGIKVSIQNPEYKTRMAILKKKVEYFNLNICDEAIAYIAKNAVANIRELEALLYRVIAFSKINNSPITIDFISELLKK